MGQLVPSERDAGAVQTLNTRRPRPADREDRVSLAPSVSAGSGTRSCSRRFRDPRLHLAAVIISIHILGQTVLGFRVSVVQILVAILTCAVIEVTWTFASSRSLVWPASAMLTGSGVALIFRVIGTENGDYWSWHGWYLFAIVAGLSLLTKYVIKYRGSHVFNPSNVGLVAAFLILGSTRVEPLDFWWAPFGVWMALAYLIIIVGGVLITRRLHLLGHVGGVLDHAGGRHRRGGGLGTLHDGALVVHARVRLPVLVGDRDLARGADLPLLHDHRPEDGAGRTGGTARLRRVRRLGQHAADRTADDRVQLQGRVAGGARRDVRGSLSVGALLPGGALGPRTDPVPSWPGSRRSET